MSRHTLPHRPQRRISRHGIFTAASPISASVTTPSSEGKAKSTSFGFSNDLTALWEDAIYNFNQEVGFDSPYRIKLGTWGTKDSDLETKLLNYMKQFEHYRQPKDQVQKIRHWLGTYLRPINGLCQQLSAAASVAFAPAGAIGMALTFFIQVAGHVKANYDFLLGLFEVRHPEGSMYRSRLV
jgi:hypothetical protein